MKPDARTIAGECKLYTAVSCRMTDGENSDGGDVVGLGTWKKSTTWHLSTFVMHKVSWFLYYPPLYLASEFLARRSSGASGTPVS